TNRRGSESRRSIWNQTTGSFRAEAIWVTSVVLPKPAGALTSVNGDGVSVNRASNRSRRIGARAKPGILNLVRMTNSPCAIVLGKRLDATVRLEGASRSHANG